MNNEGLWFGASDVGDFVFDPKIQTTNPEHVVLFHSERNELELYDKENSRKNIVKLNDEERIEIAKQKYLKWRKFYSSKISYIQNGEVKIFPLDQPTTELEAWHAIGKEFEIDLSCGFFMEQAEGHEILEKVEEDEFRKLLEEVSAQGFTHSKQISNYIVKNRLGDKYKNISGILQMEAEGEIWSFNGGFPPKIYAKLCEELGLRKNHSQAHPVSFKPYKDLNGE